MWLWHCRRRDDSRADCTAGNNSAISIVMMPIVTKTSTSVTPRRSIIATTLLRNDCNQRIATFDEPHRRIPSRVRCIALLGASVEYMGSKRNVNHAKTVPVNAAEPPDEKVMSLAEGANVLLVGVWVVIGYESLKGGRIRWM